MARKLRLRGIKRYKITPSNQVPLSEQGAFKGVIREQYRAQYWFIHITLTNGDRAIGLSIIGIESGDEIQAQTLWDMGENPRDKEKLAQVIGDAGPTLTQECMRRFEKELSAFDTVVVAPFGVEIA